MIILDSNGQAKIYQVKLPLRDSDGNEVDTNLYSVTNPTNSIGTVITPYTFQSDDSFSLGDNILITSDNQVKYPNTITNVGDNYRVAKQIEQNLNTQITIIPNYTILQLNNLPEGLYYFANNEALIVSDTFSNLRISFTDLNSRYDSLNKNIDLEAKNNEAIKSVIADFSFKPDFFRYLDLNQIRELVILKMLIWITFGTQAYEDSLKNYTNFKQDVINILRVNTDDSVENADTIDEGAEYSFTWHWRA